MVLGDIVLGDVLLMVANIIIQKVPWGISNIQSCAGISFFFSKLNDRDERISVCIFCVLAFIVKAYILRFACTAFLGKMICLPIVS